MGCVGGRQGVFNKLWSDVCLMSPTAVMACVVTRQGAFNKL